MRADSASVIATRDGHESRSHITPSENHFVTHSDPKTALVTSLATLRRVTDSARPLSIGSTATTSASKRSRRHSGRDFVTLHISLKLTSTMPIDPGTVHTSIAKPIQPSLSMSILSTLWRIWFSIPRACSARAAAWRRFSSLADSSASVATAAIGSSCPFSSWTTTASNGSCIFRMAKSLAPSDFAPRRSMHKTGTIASMQ